MRSTCTAQNWCEDLCCQLKSFKLSKSLKEETVLEISYSDKISVADVSISALKRGRRCAS